MSDFDRAAERFIERMGLAAEEDRLPRIAGRIWGLLVLEGGPLSIDDIAEKLSVSRASVSTNARRLESLHILAKAAKPGDRRDYFEIVEHPAPAQVRQFAESFRDREREVLEMAELVENHDEQAAQRLRDLSHFFGSLADGFEKVNAELETWHVTAQHAV